MLPKTVTFWQGSKSKHIFKYVCSNKNGPVDRFALKVLAMDGHFLDSLDALITHIPTMKDKKYFNMDYVNFLPAYDEYFDNFFFGHPQIKVNITYDENIPKPMLYTFNSQAEKWEDSFLR